MKDALNRFFGAFTVSTLICIGVFGFFDHWNSHNTNIWGYTQAFNVLITIIWHRFIKKRQ